MSTTAFSAQLKTILLATGLVLTLSMGIRHGFGFWLQPISQAHGWTRETYSLAIALQNLMWGVLGPFAGMAADRFGTAKVVLIGAVCYAAGLVWMALVNHPTLFVVGTGVLIGLGLACTTFGVVSGLIARNTPESQRSWAFGIAGAASSIGQFLFMPIEQQLIAIHGWQNALYLLAFTLLLIMCAALPKLDEPIAAHQSGEQQSIWGATKEAFSYRSFQFLVAGYFVCGFQLVFIGVHMPAYLRDNGLNDPRIAVFSLALIGLFNILGSFLAGHWGTKIAKRYLLSAIYLTRALVIALFLLIPLSAWTVYFFSAAMGVLWLSTVPLTNGVIASIFGVRYLSMLSGFVFLSHQIGSFFGAWLGGYLFAQQGSYNTLWMVTIVLGVLAGLINLPINEQKIIRHTVASR